MNRTWLTGVLVVISGCLETANEPTLVGDAGAVDSGVTVRDAGSSAGDPGADAGLTDAGGLAGDAGHQPPDSGVDGGRMGDAGAPVDAGTDDAGMRVDAGTGTTEVAGDCSSEPGLTGRHDLFFCEPFERTDWYSAHHYVSDAYATRPMTPATADDVSNTRLVSSGCRSGQCLQVSMQAYQSGALAVHWPLINAGGARPDEVFLRYWLKLGPHFSPELCADQAPHGHTDNGGKFPGLADVRLNNEATGEVQCGNGGEYADGIHCWSMRAKFRNCLEGEGTSSQACDSPTATTRFGGYVYGPTSSQEFANWDTVTWGSGASNGPCATDPSSVGNCGVGSGGQFENDRWYAIEMQIKMNTVGAADGVIRGWVDGHLSYEKTNMVFRLAGHDGLHVRTVWLNVHAGGEFMGLCNSSEVFLDQLVVAQHRIGPERP